MSQKSNKVYNMGKANGSNNNDHSLTDVNV